MQRSCIFCLLIVIAISVEAPIQEFLKGQTLEGTWKSIDQQKQLRIFPLSRNPQVPITQIYPMHFFSSNSSIAQGFFYEVQTDEGTQQMFFIRILDGKYLDNRAIELTIPLKEGYNMNNNSWQIADKYYYSATLFENRKELIKFDFKAKVKIEKHHQILTPFTIPNQIDIQIQSESLQIFIQLSPVKGGIHFFWVMFMINLVQLGLLGYFGKDQRVLFNTSEWLILQTICLFVIQSLFMFKIALSHYDTPLFYLLITALLNMLVLLLLLTKFETVMEKFKNSKTFKLGLLFVLSYLLTVLFFGHSPQFWLVQGMVFMWQIIHSMRHGGSGGVSVELVLVVVLSRIPLICTLGLQDNIYRMSPDKAAANILVIILAFHLMLIFVQRKIGSRILVPQFLIPDFYEYRRNDTYMGENSRKQCSICLNELRESPEHMNQTEENREKNESTFTQIQETKALERVFFAVTPCKHYYHMKCLSDWLETKLTCPLCKRGLPPMGAVL